MTCAKALRDAALLEIDPRIKAHMQAKADALDLASAAYCANNTSENLGNLNGAWVSAWRALRLATPINPTDPQMGSGYVEPERMAA